MTQPSSLPAATPIPRVQKMLSPHAVLTGLLGIIIAATTGMLLINLIAVNTLNITLSVVGLIFFAGLLFAHLRGWPYSPHATVIAAIAFTIAGNPPDITTRQLSFTVLIPSVLAAMYLPWYWTLAAFLVCVAGIGAQSAYAGLLFRPDAMLLALIVVFGSVAAGAFGRSAQRTAEERADLLVEEKGRAETQAQMLAEANELMNAQLDQQQKLLDLVTMLETPVVKLADGVLFAPLVGHIDTRRAQDLTERLLREAHTQRARRVILDIAGVPVMDTQVAHALVNTTQALKLLGCSVTICSISSTVAMTLTHLGVALQGVTTARDPQEALAEGSVQTLPALYRQVN